ncbi:hypothetical protein HF086_008418 [Spodoptera exigua]|uniref:Transketolase-like pyrimidine-binding domain-containing protein n=1 Tax=Spodoptera exigua TaxID=7107 RepID=A0A922MGL6_SPOEX|nr:hypothetical protein HF086_008418 [Spodoptera exigua]
MLSFKVGARQLMRWKELQLDRLKYHSGVGVFGHRPTKVNDVDLPEDIVVRRNENCRAQRLVDAYRTYGHLRATIDNVNYKNEERNVKELNVSRYGLSSEDAVDLGLVYGYEGKQSVKNLTEAEREWFAQRVENGQDVIDNARRIEIAKELIRSQAWDKFLALKFPTVKRYCGEGAESILTFFSSLLKLTSAGTSVDIPVNGKSVRFSLLNNPSHLEVHGDAAFAGQGINQEMLMMSQAPHFNVGGSMHVIVNNQLGFTLPAARGRSSRYVTDLAKSIAVPVIHVNADHPEVSYYQEQWAGFQAAPNAVETWDTGVDTGLLQMVGHASVAYPDDFNIHPHLAKTHVRNRLSKLAEGKDIDWATAEALAFGSLLMEGRHVRLSGEDVGRGTFSHRHVMLVDQNTEAIHIPLNHIHEKQKGFLEVANSILSEEAVLAFEYGMAFDSPDNLCIWEAQFGDFYNGAQIIVDTFIASGESKWVRSNGLVMLLPHGYDGAASEHSSCRLERFLQQTDSKESTPDSENVCLHVANATTPAQYFHLLRRQILLRLADAVSNISDFAPGTHFKNVIGDPLADPLKVKRVILVSGKHYYELHKERLRANVDDVAIIRVEGLAPFPLHELQIELQKFKNARKFIWSQEEHRNMGAWSFIKPRFENLLGRKLLYSGRAEGATPAVGAAVLHRAEVEHIIKEPLHTMK